MFDMLKPLLLAMLKNSEKVIRAKSSECFQRAGIKEMPQKDRDANMIRAGIWNDVADMIRDSVT